MSSFGAPGEWLQVSLNNVISDMLFKEYIVCRLLVLPLSGCRSP